MTRVLSFISFVWAVCLLLFSCASEKTVQTRIDSDRAGKSLMEQRMGISSDKKGPVESTTLGKGQLDFDKQSAFTGKMFNNDKDGIERKSYEKKAYDGLLDPYEKKRWGDSKSYNDGKRDQSDFNNQMASVNRDQSDWQGQGYDTSSYEDRDKVWTTARDKQFERKTDEHITQKRNEIIRPKIVSSKENQMKTVEEVRSMLGRDS